MSSITTILADAHDLFMDGFERIIEELDYPAVKVVGKASSAGALKELMHRVEADLVFLELNFSDEDGLALIPYLKKHFPDTRICVLSGYVDHKFVKEAMQNGADGYYSKYNDFGQLTECVNEIMLGNAFLAAGLQITPKKNGISETESQPFEDRFLLRKKLTRREQEVLSLITKAMNNKEIAEELYISDQTVGVHRKNIMRKLGVRNTVNLIKFAIDHQLV
ncbi:MAG: DNA-binding NarL/FixJ family response regulator [Saprospiraceae bacterium]|jgi:DNA-binding NarL/FixJ family response regulator